MCLMGGVITPSALTRLPVDLGTGRLAGSFAGLINVSQAGGRALLPPRQGPDCQAPPGVTQGVSAPQTSSRSVTASLHPRELLPCLTRGGARCLPWAAAGGAGWLPKAGAGPCPQQPAVGAVTVALGTALAFRTNARLRILFFSQLPKAKQRRGRSGSWPLPALRQGRWLVPAARQGSTGRFCEGEEPAVTQRGSGSRSIWKSGGTTQPHGPTLVETWVQLRPAGPRQN